MGVTCVMPIQIPDGKSAKQVVDAIQNRLESVGAEKLPSWTLDCETYQSVPQGTDNNVKLINLVHCSESPELMFSVLENNMCMVSEVGFDSIVSKLKAFYTPRKGGKIEVKGTKYSLADFIIKVGNITQVSSFKGLTLEVEYLPCYEPCQCWKLLGEFILSYIDATVQLPTLPSGIVDKKLGCFSEADTVVQYLPLLSLQSKRV